MANELSKMSGMTPSTFNEAKEYAQLISKSDFVPREYKNKPAEILICIQMGAELGLKPIQALQNIAVINGKPSIYGDSAIALCRTNPDFAGIEEKVEGTGDNRKATCTVKRKLKATGEIEVTIRTFSMQEAKQANLSSRGPWKSYPDRMLQMRARGFALRDSFPDSLKALITTEEAADYPPEENKTTVEVEIPKQNGFDTESLMEEAEELTPVQPTDEQVEAEEVEPESDFDPNSGVVTSYREAVMFHDMIKALVPEIDNLEELTDLWKNNKNQFERVNALAEPNYKEILELFKQQKAKIKGENNG